jgi:hypothetical protein
MINPFQYWDAIGILPTKNYKCGYPSCGKEIGADKGWLHRSGGPQAPQGPVDGLIYACPLCKNPTFFDEQANTQFPGVSLGSDVNHLPSEIQPIWHQVEPDPPRWLHGTAPGRPCSIGASGSSVLSAAAGRLIWW